MRFFARWSASSCRVEEPSCALNRQNRSNPCSHLVFSFHRERIDNQPSPIWLFYCRRASTNAEKTASEKDLQNKKERPLNEGLPRKGGSKSASSRSFENDRNDPSATNEHRSSAQDKPLGISCEAGAQVNQEEYRSQKPPRGFGLLTQSAKKGVDSLLRVVLSSGKAGRWKRFACHQCSFSILMAHTLYSGAFDTRSRAA